MSSPRRHTILHYVGGRSDGGGILSVVRTVAVASEAEAEAILGVEPGFQQRREPPLTVWELPSVGTESITPASILRSARVALRVAGWLGMDRRRVFHGHSRVGLLVGLWLAGWGESRVVVSVHCYGSQRWFYRWAYALLGSRLCWLSPQMKRYYDVGGRGWQGCVANAVDAARFRSARAPASGSRVPGRLRLGGAGFLIERKGWHVLVDALARLNDEERGRVSFCHAGECDGTAESARYAEGLYRRVADQGLTSMVRWLGHQPSIRTMLAEIDLLVVPSFEEPFGLVILEAWAAGVPVLASDSGGPCDLIEPGVTGWLFATGDSAALTRALRERLASQGGERLRLGLPVRHSAAAARGAWAEIYRDVVAGGAVI